METIKEDPADHFIKKHLGFDVEDNWVFRDGVKKAMVKYADLKNAETIELYNRKCERANDLNEENNRLKERVKELTEELESWKKEHFETVEDAAETIKNLQEENNRLKELLMQSEAVEHKTALILKSQTINQLQKQIQSLTMVADIAATCVMDLNANLRDAYEEFMSGELNNGAYQYVLARHGNLIAALDNAGYTEQHPLFKFPMKPQVEKH